MTFIKPSHYQSAIFNEVSHGTSHLVIQARAGTGKTTTMIQAAQNHIPAHLSVGFFAFNKSIAAELTARLTRKNCEAKTFHSYGNSALYRAFGRLKIQAGRVAEHVRQEYPKLERAERAAIVKAVSLAKGSLAKTVDDVLSLDDEHTLFHEDRRERHARATLAVLDWCRDVRSSIDFDDMVWLPVVHNVRTWQYDRVIIDETQDLNACQLELALRACKRRGRIIAVGDPAQAIYRFRGADSAAMERIQTRLDAKVLPLSRTYRCAKAIVREARPYVTDYEAAETNPEGIVREIDVDDIENEIKIGDFLLSRSNAPLIALCLDLLVAGLPAAVAGRDVGEGLRKLIASSQAQDPAELAAWVATWRVREIQKAILRDPEANTDPIDDRADCILAIADGCETLAEVVSRCEALFADGRPEDRIMLSSTHKAKGLERDRVFVLRDTYLRRRKNMSRAQEQEERNLFYVAITRAKTELIYVNGEP